MSASLDQTVRVWDISGEGSWDRGGGWGGDGGYGGGGGSLAPPLSCCVKFCMVGTALLYTPRNLERKEWRGHSVITQGVDMSTECSCEFTNSQCYTDGVDVQ